MADACSTAHNDGSVCRHHCSHARVTGVMRRRAHCRNEELFEGLLLHGERDVPDAEAGAGDAEVGAAQLGVLLLSCPLALGPVSHRQAVPGC